MSQKPVLVIKKAIPLIIPWRLIGLQDIVAPTFCLDNRLTDGGKVVSPTWRLLFTPQEDSWYAILLESESTPEP
jgi:hypothetical protein